MRIEEIEKNIVNKVINHYKEFDIAKVVISQYRFVEITAFNFQTLYYNNGILINLKENASIANEVNEILKLLFEKKHKSNYGTITIYADGRYESEFIWDEQADLDYRFQEVWQAVHFLGDNYFRQHLNTHYPDWESAVVSLKVKPEESIAVPIQIKRGDLEEEEQFTLPESLEQGLLKMHYQINEGDFKSLLNPWNTLELRLKSQSSFDYQQDASFL